MGSKQDFVVARADARTILAAEKRILIDNFAHVANILIIWSNIEEE